ncbi:MAG: putative hydro-lyase [Treponema sp.]|nr:putative hydro-lyase [Treponema sp.]
MHHNSYEHTAPKDVRMLIRKGVITGQTSGMCAGYAQANLCVLPREYAYDFLLFCQRNPKSCPLLEVSDAGSRLLHTSCDADIATDIPRYRVWKNGELAGEYTDVSSFWRDDLVSFIIGCSFSFESLLLDAGIDVRNISENHNVPMYLTNIETERAGVFGGKIVVSMRPIPYSQVVKATTVTARMPRVHGSPVHIGDPSAIGIHDIAHPDFGEPSTIREGEVPVFWCCGVTPQSVVMQSKPSFCITHAPGHMLLTDIKDSDLQE